MRIALVSPYSWTYPGGVTRHIEALAERFIADGHHVRVLAPFDPPDRFSAALHRGARPQQLEAPDYLVPLGRTVGFKANGAVSNLSITPVRLRHDAARAEDRWLRCRPRARADRARAQLGGHRQRAASYRGHVPRPLDERNHQRRGQGARRRPGVQPAARADRRLGGRRLDRAPLLRRPLSRDPERRPRRSRAGPPGGGASARRGAADRVRGPSRGAQGSAAVAAGVRGAAGARSLRADGDRAGPRGARAADARRSWRARSGEGQRPR